ncbi:MAG TPA: hypothetical protein VHE60_05370 [Pyrinomonadaceae bacterium]|nr:hypothetical protein [Pyrinomonadaceae bacterium]
MNENTQENRIDRMKMVLKTAACVAVPLVCVVLWFLSGWNWFVLLLLSLLSFACEEWLGEQWLGKIFHEKSRWSVSNSGFSIVRIIFGVIVVLCFFGAVYALRLLFLHWFR